MEKSWVELWKLYPRQAVKAMRDYRQHQISASKQARPEPRDWLRLILAGIDTDQNGYPWRPL